jgi:hypothetical protein
MMQGNEQLYYNDKESVKLVDIEKMNGYLKSYPQIRDRLAAIGHYSFNAALSQEEQTEHFMKTLSISRKQL